MQCAEELMCHMASPTFEQRKQITLMKQGQNTHQNRENEGKDTKNYAGGKKNGSKSMTAAKKCINYTLKSKHAVSFV